MYIEYTKTFTTPGGVTHHAGEREDCARSVAEGFFHDRVAQEVKFSSFAERMAYNEAQRQKDFPPVSTAPEWTVVKLPSQKFAVRCKQLTSELIYGEVIVWDRGRPDFKASTKQLVYVLEQAGCPKEIRDRYVTLRNAPDQLEADSLRIEQDKRRAAEQVEREKHQVRFI